MRFSRPEGSIDPFKPRTRVNPGHTSLVVSFFISVPLVFVVFGASSYYSELFTNSILPLAFPYIFSSRGILAAYSLQDSYNSLRLNVATTRFLFILSIYLLILGITLEGYRLRGYDFIPFRFQLSVGLFQLITYTFFKVMEAGLARVSFMVRYSTCVFFYLGINDVGIFICMRYGALVGPIDTFEKFGSLWLSIPFLGIILFCLRYRGHWFRDAYMVIIVLTFGFIFNGFQGNLLFIQNEGSSNESSLIPVTTVLANIGGNIVNTLCVMTHEVHTTRRSLIVLKSVALIFPWLLFSPFFTGVNFKVSLLIHLKYFAITLISNFLFFTVLILIYFLIARLENLTVFVAISSCFRDLWETIVLGVMNHYR